MATCYYVPRRPEAEASLLCDSDRFQVSPFGAKVSVRYVFDRLYQENWLEQWTNEKRSIELPYSRQLF